MRLHLKHGFPKSTVFILCVFFMSFLCVFYMSAWRWNDSKLMYKRIFHKFSISEQMGSTDVFEVVQPNINTVLSQPHATLLQGRRSMKRPFAVIVVTSMAKYFSQRRSIRSTWGRWASKLNIRVFFMIGFHDFRQQQDLFEILLDEQRIFNDLIIDEFEEGYYKLPGKVLRILKWYNNTYTEANSPRFFVKTDHDVFINLPNLVDALHNTSYYRNFESLSHSTISQGSIQIDKVNVHFNPTDPDSYYIGGKRFTTPPIESNPYSKWYIGDEERESMSWSSDVYPTYTNGPCYIMSGNVVKRIYEASFSVPIYPFEDVYVVGMVAYHKLHLQISDIDEMRLDARYFKLLKDRKQTEEMVAMHPVDSPTAMIKLCKRVSSCKAQMDPNSSGEQTISSFYFICSMVLTVSLAIT